MANPQDISVNTRIVSIEPLEFELYPDAISKITTQYDRNKFQFEQNFQVQMDSNDASVNIILTIKIFAEPKKENLLALGVVKGKFFLEQLNELLEKYENKIPTAILWTFIGATASTARGILIMQLKGSDLEGSILPFLKADFLFDNSEKVEG